jgi:3-isopropylmalate/(R)-2-methylmalate dehydratase small subunit
MMHRFDAPLASPYLVLDREHVDTDQIIPARFLMTGLRSGLGKYLFYNWRFTPNGVARPDFPLDLERRAQILVAGANFGCGSSREHAVWSLLDAGIRVVVSASFGDIFRGNAPGNGLLTVELSPDAIARLMASPAADPLASLTVDLEAQRVDLPDGTTESFAIPPFSKYCLQSGLDELDYLLSIEPQRLAFETRPRRVEMLAPGS